MKNKITVEFRTSNWESELLKKGVLFNESGHSFDDLEDDVKIIRSYDYFGNTRVEMEVKKWVVSALEDCRDIEKIICEDIVYVRGAGKFVEKDVPDYAAKSLYEVLS